MGTKHPQFVRPNRSVNRRVKEKWRKPRGIDNKQAGKIKWAGAVVNKGYRGPNSTRDNHPQGKKEFMVMNLNDLRKFEKELKGFVLRLQATLSKKSKEAIRKKAGEMGLKVLN
ncbi:50S ribosomal protein L32e [Candidatus Micrarchaeota archaeon]|nr:50S ribosomal protein L32e [Candidatus Micrarchaeota archaeon]